MRVGYPHTPFAGVLRPRYSSLKRERYVRYNVFSTVYYLYRKRAAVLV